jgi:hypothetical protein
MPMNRFLTASCATALLGLAGVALASPTFELTDGSRIQGDIQSIEHGVYTVTSPTLGTMHISQDSVARILYGGGSSNRASSPNADNGTSQQIAQIQQRLTQDPDALKAIMSLQNDPQIQAILSDPTITRAIQNGDYLSLLDNDKIKALESNAQLQQLLQQQEQ